MDKAQIQVLLIEDNPVDVVFLREALEQDALNSFDLVTAERLQAALALLLKNTFDVILLDLGLPDIQGLESYTRVQQAVPQIPKVILSELTDETLALQALQAGAQDYIVKGTAGFAAAARAIRYAIERQQTQTALRLSEERFRALIEHGSDDISLLDAEGNLLWESPAVIRNLGYPENAFVGSNIFRLIHPDDKVWTTALYTELVQNPAGRQAGIFRLQHADGSWRWVEAVITNMLENPSVHAVVANYHDITERKQAELERQALLEIMQGLANTDDLHEFLKLIHNSIAGVIYAENFFVVFHDKDTGLFEEIYSIDKYDEPAPPSALEKSITSYVFHNGEPLLLTQAMFEKLVEQGEVELVGTNSESWMGAPLKTQNGTIGVIAVQHYEIPNCYTERDKDFLALIASQVALAIERKLAEEQLRKLSRAVEHSASTIVITDTRGNIEHVNPKFTETTGYTAEEAKGQNPRILSSGHTPQKEYERLWKAITSGQEWRGEFLNRKKNGELYWESATISPTFNERGETTHFIAVKEDITERKQAEEAVRSLARFPEENPNPILRVGKNGQISYANAASGIWLAGWKVSLNDPLPEEWWLPVADAYRRDAKETLELSIQDRIYSIMIVPFQESGYINIYGRDITESKLAEEKLRENAADEALINSLNEAANRGESLEALIRLLGAKFETMFSAKGTGLYLLSEDGKCLRMPGFSLPEGVVRNLEKLIGRQIPPLKIPIRAGGTFQKFLQAEGGTILTEPQEIQQWMTEFTEAETVPAGLEGLISQLRPTIFQILGIRSTISLPLRSAGKTTGLLGISSANILGQEDLKRLQKIGTQLASAIQRKQAELAIKENSEDLALINLLNETINRRESLATLVRVLEKEFRRLFNTKGTALYLLSEDRTTLNMPGMSVPHQIAGKIEKLIGRPIPSIGISVKPGGLFHKLLNTPEGTITTDPREIQQWISEFTETESLPASFKSMIRRLVPQIYKLLNIKSIISLPLTLDGKTIGVLDVSSAHQLNAQDLERFRRLGGQLSAGILRHQDEQKLRESDERFRQLSDNIQESFWITDAISDEEIYISLPAEKIWGRSVKSMLDTPNAFIESVLPEDRPLVLRALAEQKNGRRTETEYRIVQPDGAMRWIWDRAFPIFDDAGRVVRLAGVVADITERKQHEQKLRESNERFEQLANNIEEAFWITSARTREEIYLSPATEKIWGMPVEALKKPNAFLEHVLTEDRGLVESALARQSLGEKTEVEYRIMAPDGTIRWVWDRSFPILDADGELLNNAGLSTDITEIKETQHELEVLNRTLESRVHERTAEVQDLYDKAPCGYHSLDKDGIFVKVNETELHWLGYAREELVGVKSIRDLFTPQSQLRFDESFPRFKEQGWIRDLEFEMIRKDGSLLPVLLNAAAIFDADGTYVQSRSTIFDITERRKVEEALRTSEEQLRSANAALEKAARLKDEFMASMSHELRTPLNAILGLSESLNEQVVGPLTEKQQKYVQTINESGRHLLHLINDILDLAKIEAGQIVLDLAKVDLRVVCEASMTMVRHLAFKKNQQIEFQMDEKINWIHADARSLKQMLVNLLSNAIKFTPPGGQLGLIVQSDAADQKVLITVWDNGIGIDEGDLRRLFQPFVQLNAGLARENTGTGLGLALVARMARLHGGSVGVVSRPGQGARFNIILPWVSVSESEAMAKLMITGKFKAINLNSQNKKTILLVEDTDTVILLVKDFLELSGYKVEVARSGYEAIAQLERIRPDLILMDVQMSGMDGLEATRIIRSTDTVKHVPIIALTALAMPGDRERCIAAGMNEYISKPINLKNFIKIIQSLLLNAQENRPV